MIFPLTFVKFHSMSQPSFYNPVRKLNDDVCESISYRMCQICRKGATMPTHTPVHGLKLHINGKIFIKRENEK